MGSDETRRLSLVGERVMHHGLKCECRRFFKDPGFYLNVISIVVWIIFIAFAFNDESAWARVMFGAIILFNVVTQLFLMTRKENIP